MADMINVLNTILANASTEYQARVPQATRDNISEVGSAVMGFAATENEFLSALVNKVAMTIVRNKTFKNPLSVLKKGGVPLGQHIEEIYTNPVTGVAYDPTGADLISRSMPDTKAIYHSMNRQGKYKATVSKSQLLQAFKSYRDLENLLNSIVNAIYSGDNMDEFILMKNLFSSAIKGGKLKTVRVDEITNTETARKFVKDVKKAGKAMTMPTTAFNAYADLNEGEKPVTTWTPTDDQILIIRNDISVDVDVEMFAQAFNVDYAKFNTRCLEVDSFGAGADNCYAILCDKAFVQVYDNLMQMENFHNGEGLYDNFILHHWQTYSLSLFANAVAFCYPTT